MNDTTFGQSGEIPQLDGGNPGRQAGRQLGGTGEGGRGKRKRASGAGVFATMPLRVASLSLWRPVGCRASVVVARRGRRRGVL